MDNGLQPNTQQFRQPSSPKKLIIIIVSTIVALGLLTWGLFAWLGNSSSKESADSSDQESPAQALFREMVTAVSSKEKLKLTVAEKNYNSKGDLESGKTLSELYATAEYDTGSKEYRALFIATIGENYPPAKCLEGKAFTSTKPYLAFTTLEASLQEMSQPFTKAEANPESRTTESCNVNSTERKARITDGIVPIGMNSSQINTWFKVIAESDFLTAVDEGTETYKGKAVRKLSLTTASIGGAGQFRAVASGAGLDIKGAESWRLDELTIPFADNISGYYLIDETTKLPVYSEFTSVGLIDDKGQPRPGGIVKSQYAYPSALSLGQTSNLPILE